MRGAGGSGSRDAVQGDKPASIKGRDFLGHPRGLGYLVLTEVWERFSYFGLTANLVLYMNKSLLTPAHVGDVVGLDGLRAGLEAMLGPLTTLALASQIYGLYAGFVYFTPIFGGAIADRWLGRRRSVVAGAMLMSAGHFAMAFDESFLLAMLLMILGCGLLKGNISTQVGELYPPDDEVRRAHGFTLFSVGINVGAIAGPLVCGLLAAVFGWHVGFTAAGVLMLVGLLTYLAGYRHLPDTRPARDVVAKREALSVAERRTMAFLSLTILITIFTSIACYQTNNIGLVWIDRHVDLDVAGSRVPTAWFSVIAPLCSIVGVPALFALWRRRAARGREPGELNKIITGAWIAACANGGLAAACLMDGPLPIVVPVVYTGMLGMAYLYYWPTLMALVSRVAPPGWRGTLMGFLFLSLFAANLVIGWLGRFYAELGPAAFWAVEALIGAVGALLATIFMKRIERELRAPRSGAHARGIK